ncbi:hypothetical protein CERSUDRAFT_91886 [Gelatoporia subvermispora B]|uniref:Uncharacterized protein n=1 Tax=Ceriporiopsis subvermispora (strain B) TaxID=914234 RepID=M2QVI6_CERS8|nr:hypothetical protein CERSUDRAFT_91886 [Gelatoporia subvermispora B]
MSQSDLDADLYGDLYGNDENDFSAGLVTQAESNLARQETQEIQSLKESSPAPVKTEDFTESVPVAAKPIPTVSSDVAAQPPPTSNAPANANAATYAVPTQQIPTYEERSTPDYREPAQQRQDYAAMGAPINRPVRPSEMKEEGAPFWA